ncbi:MAG TPA: hypothetical protein ENF34_03495 [Candidatus Bathyarchaeota archaeon]|nr:hypothetical protein [Candidatus Bathyarchaeota archaeon]
MGKRDIYEIEARSDYIATLLTYYEAIMMAVDRWINVSWTFASIFIPASMVLAGIVVSAGIEGWVALILSGACFAITLCWFLLWYRTFMFNEIHLKQLAAIEEHLAEKLNMPEGLCPQLTMSKKLKARFGRRANLIKIRYIIPFICGVLCFMWALMLGLALLSLLAP